MRRFAIALLSTTVLGAGFVQIASAADLPARGRAPAYGAPIAEPYANWSGFYLGGSLGGRWNDAEWTTVVPFPGVGSPATYDSSSFRGGIYGGVNFQFAPMWVAGIEADIGWAKNESTRTGIPGLSVAADSTRLRQDWDGSVVGRLGMLVTPATLLYGLGGASWIDVESNTNCTGTAGSFCGVARNQTNDTTARVGPSAPAWRPCWPVTGWPGSSIASRITARSTTRSSPAPRAPSGSTKIWSRIPPKSASPISSAADRSTRSTKSMIPKSCRLFG